jgi:prepilin signal peptidase PulO-like enzyme (type II secretory pathway)
MNEKTVDEKIELIRAWTRSAAFLIPLVTICAGMFLLANVQDTLVGAVMGSAATAGVFYFEKIMGGKE